jgi:Protein of unknown function (DUF3105).
MEKRDKDAKAKAAPARASRRWLWVGAAAVVAAVAVGVFVYRAAVAEPGVSLPDQGNRHVQTLNEPIPPYNSEPPTSGPPSSVHRAVGYPYRAPSAAAPGAQSRGRGRHGPVLLSRGLPRPRAKLKAIVSGYEHQVILAPYPGMKTRIALTAWTKLDAFNDFDEKRIRRFITAYRGIDHHPR